LFRKTYVGPNDLLQVTASFFFPGEVESPVENLNGLQRVTKKTPK